MKIKKMLLYGLGMMTSVVVFARIIRAVFFGGVEKPVLLVSQGDPVEVVRITPQNEIIISKVFDGTAVARAVWDSTTESYTWSIADSTGLIRVFQQIVEDQAWSIAAERRLFESNSGVVLNKKASI